MSQLPTDRVDLVLLPATEKAAPADDNTLLIAAGLFVNVDAYLPIPVDDESIIVWDIVSGTGGSLSTFESFTKSGSASVYLMTGTIPGEIFRVRARAKTAIIHGEKIDFGANGPSAITANIVVVPGEPKLISIQHSVPSRVPSKGLVSKIIDLISGDEFDVTFELTAKDAFGNFVGDGSGVNWETVSDGIARFVQEDSETKQGKASATLRYTAKEPPEKIRVNVDGFNVERRLAQ